MARTTPVSSRIVTLSSLLLAAVPSIPAVAQGLDCQALRARIGAAGGEADAGRLNIAIRQGRAELRRVRTDADDSGCGGNSVLDDPDAPRCRALLRREQQLRDGIGRLESQVAEGGDDPDRRAAIEQYDATCAGADEPDATPPMPDALVPVDPDAPAGAAPARTNRFAQVLCVRHCDGAYYPLAVDVPADQLGGMDRMCQAQCPNAASSAYTRGADEDVGKAQAPDGSSYSALPTAFMFQKAASPTCSCRAPSASWAQTLSEADTMIEAHAGDVTVTPEIQAQMSRPLPHLQPAAVAAKPVQGKKPRTRKEPPPATAADARAPNPGLDLTREFRRSVPSL